jgi:hypothetical protein
MADIRVVAPDGTRGAVPEAEIATALEKGFVPEEQFDREQHEAELQAEYGGIGGQAMAGVEGFARGVTLGGSDLAGAALTGLANELSGYQGPRLTAPGLEGAPVDERSNFELGFDVAREEQRNRAAANPMTAGVGEVVGAVAPSLLTGGGSALAKGMAYAPAALMERVGASAGSALATRLGGGVGARIAGTATAGAVEGALSNFTATTMQEFPELLADPGKAAEHILASAGEGLLLGGAIGGSLGALSEGLGYVARSVEARAVRSAEESARRAASVPNVDESNFADISIQLEAKPLSSDEIMAATPDSRAAHVKMLDEVKAAQGGAEDTVQQGILEIEGAGNQMFDDLEFVDEAGVKAKLDTIARVHNINVDETRVTEAAKYLQEFEQELDGLKAKFGSSLDYDGGNAAINRLKKRLQDSYGRLSEAAQKNDFRNFYGELDDVKRTTQKVANNTKSREVREYLRDLNQGAERFRLYMEDSGAWGEAGNFQKKWNAPLSDRILKSQDSRVGGFTVQKSGDRSEVDFFDAQDRMNGESLGGFLTRLGTDNALRGKEQAFRSHIRAMAKDAANRAAMTGDEGLKQRAIRVVQNAAKIEKVLDDVARKNADAIAGTRALARSPTQELVSNAASSVVPFAGLAINGVANLKRNVLAAVASTAGETERKVLTAAAKLVKGSKRGVDAARKVAVPAAAAVSRLDQQIAEANELADPQSPASAKLLRDAVNMDDVAPGMGAAYLQSAQVRAEFIRSKMPVPPSKAIFAPAPRLDPTSERKMRRYVAASYAPTAALERIAAGSATFEDVETVRTLYPKMYAQFQQTVQAHLAELKKPPTLQERLRLAYLTGLPVDPSVENVGKLQAVAQAGASEDEQAQENGTGGQPIKLSSDPNSVYASRADVVTTR